MIRGRMMGRWAGVDATVDSRDFSYDGVLKKSRIAPPRLQLA